MRTVTAGEQTLLEGAHYATHLRVKVADADGTMQDISDRCVGGQVSQTVDQIVTTAELTFQMLHKGGQSLSPLDQTSTLNRDSGGSYQPLVDVGRTITVEVATTANASSPGASDWQLIFDGTVDEWKLGGDGARMSVNARDRIGALLADLWVEREVELGTEDGRAIESVMQDVLDEAGTGVTLYTPTAPGAVVKPYRQQQQSALEALRVLATKIGWVIEPRWDDTTSSFRLTFYEPDRTPASTSWTWAANRYYEVPSFALSRLNVRNAISVTYPEGGPGGTRTTVTRKNDASITRFGRQWMEIQEGDESPIDTLAEAQDLADNALADLKDPVAEGAKRTLCFWPVQLGDYYAFTGNDVHYSADNDFGITGFTHRWDASGQIDTVLDIRGTPVGYTTPWLSRGSVTRDEREVESALRLYNLRVLYDTPTEGQVRIKWDRGSEVFEVWYYTTTLTQPITDEKKPWPADGDAPDGVLAVGTDELDLASPDPDQVVFLQLEGRAEDGQAGNPRRVEIHPKAVSTGTDLPDGTVIYRALSKGAQRHGFTGDFTTTGPSIAAWSAGTLTLTDGSSYSIDAGSTSGLSGVTTPTYIYFDPNISTTEFQLTTNWSGDFGDDVLLIATAWAGAVQANIVQGVGLLGLDGNAIRPLSVTTDRIAANSITAGKISVATLSAISADIGTITAGLLQNASGTRFVDLDATGTDPFIKHDNFELLADGTATYGGTVTGSSFTTSTATFTGGLRVRGNIGLDVVELGGSGFGGYVGTWIDDGSLNIGSIRLVALNNGGSIRADTAGGAGLGGTDVMRFEPTKIGVFGATPVAQTAAYSPSNVTTDRAFDADSTTLAELADVVGTLIGDLQGFGWLG